MPGQPLVRSGICCQGQHIEQLLVQHGSKEIKGPVGIRQDNEQGNLLVGGKVGKL